MADKGRKGLGWLLGQLLLLPFRMLLPFLGRVSWTPPGWLVAVGEKLAPVSRFWSLHKRRIKQSILAVFLLAVFGIAGYIWYLLQPQPVRLSVTSDTPAPMRMEKDAKPNPLVLYFSGSAARLDQIGKPITAGISISPKIKGQWRWRNDSQLQFNPKEEWAVGEEYTVDFDRKLFPEHVLLRSYEHSFHTQDFVARIASAEFYQDPRDPKQKKVVATLSFSHPVDTKDLRERIRLYMQGQAQGVLGIGGKDMPFDISFDKFNGKAYIHSAPVTIPEKDTYMVLKVDSGVRAAAGGSGTRNELTRKVWIPGVYNFFRIKSAKPTLVRNERYEPEQVLILESTAGVKSEELVKNLQVFLLPEDRPAFQNQKAVRNYRWYRTEDIGPEVLRLATPVKLNPLPTDREYANLHSFKYHGEVGRYLYIKVNKGTTSFGGFVLAKPYDVVARIPQYPKELKVMHDGAILSMAGEKKLSVFSRGIDAIQFEMGRVLPDQINHVVSQTSGRFSSPSFSNYRFNQDNVTERFDKVRVLESVGPERAQYTAFDFSPYLRDSGSPRGLFFLRVKEWDTHRKRPTGRSDNRLILVTDLGVVVKDNADGSHDVFVQSLGHGGPVSGAQVSVLGKNGLPIVSQNTNERGHASLPDLKTFHREKQPTVYVVRKGSDLSFLPFERRDRELNLSRFDIGGVTTSGRSGKLDAYLFSDRGIYRPGDKFHVGLVVKPSNWKQSVTGVPLEAVVTDARGLEVYKKKISLSSEGFEELKYQTDATSPTGNYQVSLYIIKDRRRASLLGSTTVRVEEFLPDRLKISTRLSTERVKGWVSPVDLKGTVRLKNLFGTAATNRRVAAQITLTPTYPSFPGYRDYHFYDPVRAKKSVNERLADLRTNDDGEAEFDLGLQRFAKSTWRLSFLAEGYEAEGGRGVTSESSVLVSPLTYIVGYKADGDLRYLKKNGERNINLLAVDSKLEKTAVTGLKLQWVEQKYVSVLTRQPNGTYKYQSIKKKTVLSDKKLNIPAAGLKYPLPTGKSGDFMLVVKNAEDVELNRVEYSVVGQANLTRDLEKNAELQIKLNKQDFSPGGVIEMQIKAPYTGTGLITIERDKVYAYKWFTTTTTSSLQTIQIPSGMEGNGYVNVTFVRALDSEEIFMSPLSYGVAPFFISRERRNIAIKLDTPSLVRPGDKINIGYSSDRPARIAIFAVDEGILQVAKYKRPDPLSHFFKKRALEVDTRQILDLLLPEFDLVKQLSASGGGEDYGAAAIGKNLNPFKRRTDKPVAYWSGIIRADQTGRTVSYRVPDYFNGTVRVMAVAVSADAVGATQRKALVRGHFVLSPNAPTFVAPGDEFTVSIGVANNVEGSGKSPKINLDLKTSTNLKLLDKKSQVLTIGEGKESSAKFRIKAGSRLGAGKLEFVASMGAKQTRYRVELSVRPPVPYMADITSGVVKDDKVEIPVKRSMYPEYRKLGVAVSTVPLGLSRGLMQYLDAFPHGCTEQLVSKAFPAIVLRSRPEFGYSPKKVKSNLAQALHILQARQNSEGAFGFWAANSHVSDFQTVYALHFLTDAKEKGYPIPENVLRRGLSYLRLIGNQEPVSLSDARVKAYALYVLTRNGTITTRYLASLRQYLDKEWKDSWQQDLAAGYMAATYSMLKIKGEARDLIGDLELGKSSRYDYAYFYDGLVRDSQLMYLLARHFPDRLKHLSSAALQSITQPIIDGHYNTLSSSYAIIALDAYVSAVGQPQPSNITLEEEQGKGVRKPLVLPQGLFPQATFSAKAKKLVLQSDGPYNLFYQKSENGFDRKLPKTTMVNGIEIQREYRTKDGKVVKSVDLGEELEVHIKLRSTDDASHSNVAVTDLLPGGFEVVLSSSPRSGEAGGYASPIASALSTWRADYTDIREDRVVIYGTVGPEAKEFVYRIKATNRGKYVIPSAYAESMYNRAIRARTTGAEMRVE
jgi:uncharacterized protein YfaS (alpha-2-macroglobulin family)